MKSAFVSFLLPRFLERPSQLGDTPQLLMCVWWWTNSCGSGNGNSTEKTWAYFYRVLFEVGTWMYTICGKNIYKQICTVIIELFLLTQDCSLLYLHFLSCSSTWILKAFLIWNTKLGPGFGWHSSVPSIWQGCRTLDVVLLFSLLLPSCSDFRNKTGSNRLAGDDDGSKIYIKIIILQTKLSVLLAQNSQRW